MRIDVTGLPAQDVGKCEYVLSHFFSQQTSRSYVDAEDVPASAPIRLQIYSQIEARPLTTLTIPRPVFGAIGAELTFITSASEHSETPQIPIRHSNDLALDGVGVPLYAEGGSGRTIASALATDAERAGWFGFDLLGNIFHHLSCAEEWRHEKTHGSIQSVRARMRPNGRLPAIPVVDHLYLVLAAVLSHSCAVPEYETLVQCRWRRRSGFFVALTHDVDAAEKDMAIRCKKAGVLFASGLAMLAKGRLRVGWKRWAFAVRMLTSANDNYLHFARIREIEEEAGSRSTFFFYFKVEVKGWFRRLVKLIADPDYDLRADSGMRSELRQIELWGGEIGLHGSHESADDIDQLQAEVDGLGTMTRDRVGAIRQHWLRFSWEQTFDAQERVGLSWDSTLYFKDTTGFRAGTCHVFQPYDHARERSRQIREVPTVFMDMTALFGEDDLSSEQLTQQAISVLEQVKRVHGTCCINFHVETFGTDYGWAIAYQRILAWIRDNGGSMGSLKDLAEFSKAGGLVHP